MVGRTYRQAWSFFEAVGSMIFEIGALFGFELPYVFDIINTPLAECCFVDF